MTDDCFTMTQGLHDSISAHEYISSLSKNASASLLDFPDMLYDMATARDRRSAYINAMALIVIQGESLFIPATGAPGLYCSRTPNGSRPCRFLLNGGVNYTDFSVSLLPITMPESEEGPNREPFGNYQIWDPSGLQWLDIEGVVLGLRACWNTRVFNFSIDLPEDPTGSPGTAISFQGIMLTSGVIDSLKVSPSGCIAKWYPVSRDAKPQRFFKALHLTPNSIVSLWSLDGTLWGTNQGTTFVVINEVPQTIAGMNAVNCTNPLVKATAEYILQTYGSYNVQVTTNFRIKYGDDWILANTRIIDDGRGLEILLVVTLPESDYLHTVTQTKVTAIAVCSSMAAAVLILAIVISYVVTLPLRKLVTIMQQAVHLDFSPLESDWIRNCSHVKELADTGEVFEEMLVMFADAVE
ncbi:hypothetical protein BDK51DRAFT_33408, partial [Blyttiomyces helicus]